MWSLCANALRRARAAMRPGWQVRRGTWGTADAAPRVPARQFAVIVNVAGASAPDVAVTVKIAGSGGATVVVVAVTCVSPFASVVVDAALSTPPADTVHATVAPAIGFPNWSAMWTTNGAEFVPAKMVWLFPLRIVIALAPAAVAVAVIVVDAPVATDARSVFAPAVEPTVQITVALPLASVVLVDDDTLPPPDNTVHVTTTAGTAFPDASVT